MKKNYLIFSFLFTISLNSFSQESDRVEVDILFLKIQELEIEIADLRNKLESQDYLIQKLIQESVKSEDDAIADTSDLGDFSSNNTIRFAGVDDAKSKEEVYKTAIKALGDQDFVRASSLFGYFVENFSDDEKLPLSYFWLGEIAYIQEDYQSSNKYFLELITLYPDHYRIPLAHKKIGDIFLKNNEFDKAKDKYNFVIREYPNNTASSLALQLLKNME
ncbi:tetratricopeptide repeat protein [Gammaproteobacteria bacterium]|jgi:tol-pal system protein YbgF|nr:tetratricopeptide repeat protein [Gammaproteobacteria bacterium]MDA9570800.1 tetratricopeptide repeat protein [Gammaproteobacteria bacterium]MDA9921513.1 tetratricopeptide repeat protein [Gammaproteobacteria bacterium]MDB2448485.1 tetratricopeptide repeat protein [Gammaproteobacteria bacterium]MDB2503140.1 tetratricopeptide repeat protein [Gammaproteobacteria bacterium]